MGKEALREKKEKEQNLQGIFSAHPKGFGFVTVEGEDEDYYIPEKCKGTAMHGDLVQIRPMPRAGGRRREARVTQVLEHAVDTVVGIYKKSKNYGFVIADNVRILQDVFIPQGRDNSAVNGHKVVCRITDYGQDGRNPEGEIIEILGHADDPGVDILSLIRSFELPTEFPEKVLNRAGRAAEDVSEADMEGRLDLRAWQMVTIDGEDAKDLDDAVSLRRKGEAYELGVHIADVANYVQENSAPDREARERGTSVYLVDRVIPMLPHALSNGICSLNQGEDRLTLSCIMTVDADGCVTDHTIAESVIRVDRRMSYTSVNKILEGDEKERAAYAPLVPMLEEMRDLSAILRRKRRRRGSLDFDLPETKILLDDEGKVKEIAPYERNAATKLIEDFMLLANETVAEHFYWMDIPFVYRTHGVPDADKIRKLAALIGNFGYVIHGGGKKGGIHPKELQKLLGEIQGEPEEDLISRLTLRSMQQAKYSTSNTGHFGLAAEYYCHFTSPIRRYPDLQIHRIIKDCLRGRMTEERKEHYAALLDEVAASASRLERRADEVEREVDKLKKAEYALGHIGETQEGVISGVTGWGLYVELPNTLEGLIPIASLPGDYYRFEEETYELVGEHTNRRFVLGQRVNIMIESADTAARTIDFSLVE